MTQSCNCLWSSIFSCIIRLTASSEPSVCPSRPDPTAMSSSPLPPPPEYAPGPSLLGPPLYSQDASGSEVLVEASQPPPAYPNISVTRTNTSSTATTTRSSVRRSGDTLEYRHRNGNIEISLGPKVPGFDIPSYGKGGIVRGTVTLKKLTWVESVVINVCPSYPVVPDVCPRLTSPPAQRHCADRHNPVWNAHGQIIHAHSQSQASALHESKAPAPTRRSTELPLRDRLPSIGSRQ